jgi:hypothetical protein
MTPEGGGRISSSLFFRQSGVRTWVLVNLILRLPIRKTIRSPPTALMTRLISVPRPSKQFNPFWHIFKASNL